MERLYHFFLGAGFRGNGLALIRARAFIIFCSIAVITLLINIVAQPLLMPSIAYNIKLNLLVNCSLLVVFISSLTAVRFTGQILVPSHFVIFWLASVFCVLTYISGGAAKSFIVWLCWSPVLMAFLFNGLRSGIVWVVLMAGFYCALLYLGNNGHRFPMALSEQHIPAAVPSTWLNGLLMMFVLSLLYNYMLTRVGSLTHNQSSPIAEHIIAKNSHYDIAYETVENHLYQAIHESTENTAVPMIVFSWDQAAANDNVLDSLQDALRTHDIAIQMSNGYFVILPQDIHSKRRFELFSHSIMQLLNRHSSHLDTPAQLSIKSMMHGEEGIDYEAMCAVLRRRMN